MLGVHAGWKLDRIVPDAFLPNATVSDSPVSRRLSRSILLIACLLSLALAASLTACEPAPTPVSPAGTEGGDEGDGAQAPGKPAAAPVPPAVFVIGSTCDDRFENEPCNQIRSGGLSSFAAAVDGAGVMVPRKFGILMGDITQARGELGRQIAAPLYTNVLADARVNVVCAGESELGFGVRYCRELLGSVQPQSQYNVLCANARERTESGKLVNILRGSVLARLGTADSAGVHDAVVVSVAAESLQDAIARRGSDVVLDRAAPAAVTELTKRLGEASDAGLQVATRILLVQGTVAEAVTILKEVASELPPGTTGFTLAVAARGGILPDLDPADAGGVPVYYGGRGLRFVWRIVSAGAAAGPPSGSIVRLGEQLILLGSPYRGTLQNLRTMFYRDMFLTVTTEPEIRPPHPDGKYVGSAECAACHEDVAAEHAESAHAKPTRGLATGPFATSMSCMPCHVTGPFWRSGWNGPTDATDFAGISCEACHGPGESHVKEPQAGWGAVTTNACYRCHLPERSPEMDAKTLWERFGHAQKSGE